MAAIYRATPPAARSVLQLRDEARRLVLECWYLVDLQLLQIEMRNIQRRPGRANAHLATVATLQGPIAAHAFQRVGPREYLQLGQAVVDLRAQDAEAIRAWLTVEVQA